MGNNQRKNGDFGMIMMPLNDGVAVTNAELTLAASKVLGGKTFLNLFLGHALTHWNADKDITVRIQGIIGEASIAPATGNDTVQTTAAIKYFKDNTTVQTAAIDASISVTRPGSGKKCWNLIVLSTTDGAISSVKGKDGDDLVNTFGDPTDGTAGSLPFVSSTQLIIGAVQLTSSTAAPITAEDITYVDGNGRLLQERSDIPTYSLDILNGGILLTDVLLPSRTGDTTRKAFASFYSQKSVLAPVMHTTKWQFAGSRTVSEMPAQGDRAIPKSPSRTMSYSGSFSRYRVDAEMFKAAQKGRAYGKFFPDRDITAEYYECAVILKNFSEANERGANLMNDIQFDVDGEVEWREAA